MNNDDPAGLNGDVSAGVTISSGTTNAYDRLYSDVANAGFTDGITDPRLDGDTWTIVLTVTDGTLTEIETITVEFDLRSCDEGPVLLEVQQQEPVGDSTWCWSECCLNLLTHSFYLSTERTDIHFTLLCVSIGCDMLALFVMMPTRDR